MPGFLTHYLFGRQLTRKLDRLPHASSIVPALLKHPHVFNLGTQGPDLFLYYLPSNLNPKKKLGSLMHHTKTNDYFSACLSVLTQQSDCEEKEIFTSYLAGAFCHYILDTKTHPFIYARTGYEPSSTSDTHYLAVHCQYESWLDSLMFSRLRHRLPSSFDASRTIRLSRQESKLLANCLSTSITSTFFSAKERPYTSKRFIQRAISHMPIKIKFLRDTGGIKRSVIEQLEQWTIKAPILSSLFTIDQVEHSIDPLNTKHQSWCNPWQIEACYSYSFLDLYHEAFNTAIQCLDSFGRFMHSQSLSSMDDSLTDKYKEELLALLGNCSYNTGLPLS